MKPINAKNNPFMFLFHLFLLAAFLIFPLSPTGAVRAADFKDGPGTDQADPASVTLPRDQTLYFNGQQWGSLTCWNPYSTGCNNMMAINAGDNARLTMFETPYMFNMLDGQQYPLLAAGPWSWDLARTKITFKLKAAARWSDGTPLTSADVVYTWATIVKYIGDVAGISKITAPDASTVVVWAVIGPNGKAENPLWVQWYLSSQYVIQKAWTQKLETRNGGDAGKILADAAEDVVYSGPYHKYFADSSEVVLVRNDAYWGKDATMWGKLPVPKYLAHIIYASMDDGNAAFKAGKVDVSQQFIANEQNLWLVNHLPISTYLPNAPYQVGASLPTAFYNLGSYGLDQKVIRKAIAMAIDYDKIVADGMTNQSNTFTQVPRSLMNPTSFEQSLFDHAAVAGLQWAGKDVAGAKALLDAAGITVALDGYRYYKGKKLTYVATCPNGWYDWMAAIAQVAAAGQAIGIDITANYPEWSDYQVAVTNWPLPSTGYDIFMMWTDGDGPNKPWGRVDRLLNSAYAKITHNWSGNWGGYQNPAADALINALPGETNPVTIKADYTQLIKIYLTDIPSFTLMYRPQLFHTVNSTIWSNFPHTGDGTNPPVPPLDLTDGYSIAGLYNLSNLPQAFSKSAPLNGTVKQPNNPTVSWSASRAAALYEVCLNTSPSCTSPATWQSAGTATHKTFSGLQLGTQYYWQVRAKNNNGITYANGNANLWWSFVVSRNPGAFAKSSPANGATLQPSNPTLKWAASMGAARYEYCIGKTKVCAAWISNGTALSKILSGLSAHTVYYWQIRAVNSYGMTYANDTSTAWWSFTTQ